MGMCKDSRLKLLQLEEFMTDINIPYSYFSIGTYSDEAVCIEKIGNKWVIYEGERGKKYNLKGYLFFSHACDDFFSRISETVQHICCNDEITEDELVEIQTIFNSFGEAEVISEHLMDTVIGVSGSSPAYVYMFIEAMADAAVADGMPRAQAYKFAAQSVLGSAKMVLETGKHPGELKDAVCSPGGTTIEAVAQLEKSGFRSAVIEAQRACVQKSRDISS